MSRRWPRSVNTRRNSDSPTLAAVLLAASLEDSPPRDTLPRVRLKIEKIFRLNFIKFRQVLFR